MAIKSQYIARFANHAQLPTEFRLNQEGKATAKTKQEMDPATKSVEDSHTDLVACNKLKQSTRRIHLIWSAGVGSQRARLHLLRVSAP